MTYNNVPDISNCSILRRQDCYIK